jgi:tight adherence protein B
MSYPIIIMIIILAVILLGGMALAMVMLDKREKKKKALQIILGQSALNTEADKKNDPHKRRADMAKRLQKNENDEEVKAPPKILTMLRQAGWGHVSQTRFWTYSLIFGALFTGLVSLMVDAIPVIIASAFIGVLGIPKFILSFKVARRQKKFLEEFPDALESMVRLLKAGMPVGEAVAMVSREFVGPVGDEMSKVYDEQKIGISLAEACQHAAQRMPITEMQMFATGITIQQQTGSSLSEILLNLSKVIRARFRLKRKVQALSAEAKASAMIIGSLPVVVGLGMTLINPEYMEPLYQTLKGKFMLYGAIGWMACGILIMKQMINFKI